MNNGQGEGSTVCVGVGGEQQLRRRKSTGTSELERRLTEKNENGKRVRGDEGHLYGDCTSEDSQQSEASESGAAGIPSRIHQPSQERRNSRTRDMYSYLGEDQQDLAKQYIQGFEDRCRRVHEAIKQSDGYLVSDIFRFQSSEELQQMLKCIQGDRHYTRGLLQLSEDGNHVHVSHECSYSNNSCRCNWWKKTQTYQLGSRRDRRAHRTAPCRTRRYSDIQDLLFYYITCERRLVYQKVAGEMERLPSQGYSLSDSRPDELPEAIRQMAFSMERSGSELHQGIEDVHPGVGDYWDSERGPRQKRRKVGYTERLQQRILKLLKENPVAPPDHICKTSVWLDDEELMFKSMKHQEVAHAVAVFKHQLMRYTIEDYNAMYSNPNCNFIFASGHEGADNYYYDVDKSLDILLELLAFQFEDDYERIQHFIHRLFAVLEKKEPKFNTIVVHSESNAGKTFFFNCIKDYYLSVGHIGKPSKYCQFPFQAMESKRLVMWNEPSYHPEYIERIKEILGGDNTSVNVKYMPEANISRTPVIVTTNKVVSFMTHPAFKSRLEVFTWRKAPFLEQYPKFPHPLATYRLFKRFKCL